MKEDLKQKVQEMELPSFHAIHEDLQLTKNGLAKNHNGITNGFSNNCDHSGNHKLHNRKTVQNDAPSQEQNDAPNSTVPLVASMPTRKEMFMDPANICTLVGAVLSTLAMASMWKRR